MTAKSQEMSHDEHDPVLRRIRESVQKLDASPGARPSPDFVRRGRWALLHTLRAPSGRGFSHSWRSLFAGPTRLAIPRRLAVTGTAVLLAGIIAVPALAGQGPMAASFSSAASAVERAIGFTRSSQSPTVAPVSNPTGAHQSTAGSSLNLAGTPGGDQRNSLGFSPVLSPTIDPSDGMTPSVEWAPTTEPAPTPPSSDEYGPVITSTAESAPEPSDDPGPVSAPTAEASDEQADRAEPQAERDDQEHQNDQDDDVQISPTPTTEPTREADQSESSETDDEDVPPTATVSPAPDTQPAPVEEHHDDDANRTPTHTGSPAPSDDSPRPQSTPIPDGGSDHED